MVVIRTILNPSIFLFFLVSVSLHAETTTLNKVFLDLDAPVGRFATWKSTAYDKNQISGILKVVEVKKHEKWLPTFTVTLEDKNKENELWVRITNFDNGKFSIFVEYRKNKKSLKIFNYPQIIKLNEATAFKLNWQNNKQLGISFLGKKMLNMALNFKVVKIGIASSTGDLIVEELLLK